MPTALSPQALKRDEAAAIESGLRRLRVVFIAFAAFDSLAALFSFLLLGQSGHSTVVDYVLQAIISASLLMLLAWLVLGVGRSLRRAAIIAGLTVGGAYILRVIFSLYHLHRSELSVEQYFPPIACYWPIVVVFLFAVLPRGSAIRLTGLFIIVSVALTLGYVAVFPADLTTSNRGLEIIQTLVFVNPLLFLLMVISSDVHARQGQQQLSAMANQQADMQHEVAETDPITGLRKTRGFVDLLRRLSMECRNQGIDLTVGYLDLHKQSAARDPQADRIFVAEVHAALGSDLHMARLSQNRFALAWAGQGISDVMDPVLDMVLLHNENATGDQKIAVGLASWRTGETIYAILERCEEAVSKAMLPNSTGVSFNVDDLDAG